MLFIFPIKEEEIKRRLRGVIVFNLVNTTFNSGNDNDVENVEDRTVGDIGGDKA
jgi:hypothetical protein